MVLPEDRPLSENDYGEVVLARRLHDALARINSGLPTGRSKLPQACSVRGGDRLVPELCRWLSASHGLE
ncbi:MAG: hypothetical protein AB1773_04875 [Pseudomonadota bacterium]